MMHNVTEARRAIIVLLVLLLIADAAAIGVLLSPIGRSRQARQQEFETVRQQLFGARKEATPARDMDQKLDAARQQIASFYNQRLPSRYSEISQSLAKIASDSRVRLTNIQYAAEPAAIDGLQQLTITIAVTGSYQSEMNFVNGLERSRTLYVVDGVSFGGSAERSQTPQQPQKTAAETPSVQLKLSTYLQNVNSRGTGNENRS